MSEEEQQDEGMGVISTSDYEYEKEYSRKMQEARSQLKRIKTKRQAVDHEVEGRENELSAAWSLFCGLTQAQINSVDSFTVSDLEYRIRGFLEIYGLIGGTVNTSFDKENGQVGVRFSYTPDGAEAPLVSHDYNFNFR